MTTRGTRIAFLISIFLVALLPKEVECGYPGARCVHRAGHWKTTCTDVDTEPLGFYLLEQVFERNIGFAYTHDEECR